MSIANSRTPLPAFDPFPTEVWGKIIGCLTVREALNLWMSKAVGTKFDWFAVAKAHPRFFVNGHLVKRWKAYKKSADVPSGLSGLSNPHQLTYTRLIANAVANRDSVLAEQLRLTRFRDEMGAQGHNSESVAEIIKAVWRKEKHACMHCFRGGRLSFEYWGMRLCPTCGKAVLDEHQKYSFNNLSSNLIYANPYWEPWLEPAYRQGKKLAYTDVYRAAVYRPGQVERLVRMQHPGVNMQTWTDYWNQPSGQRKPDPRARYHEEVSYYIYVMAIHGKIRTWWEMGPVELDNTLLNKTCWSCMRVVLRCDFGHPADSEYLKALLEEQLGGTLNIQPVLIDNPGALKEEWITERAIDFCLWFLESDQFAQHLSDFTRDNYIFFKRGREVEVGGVTLSWLRPFLRHADVQLLSAIEFARYLDMPSARMDEDGRWLWLPKNAFA